MCSLTISLCIVFGLSVNAQVSYHEPYLELDDANKSTSIPSDWDVENPAILRDIEVRNVNVDKINSFAFKDFVNLKVLKLTGRITVIEDDAFTGMDKLGLITLNGVGIQHIGPKVFHNLNSLTMLDMAGNTINKIHLTNLTMLTHLYLSHNNITELGDNTFVNLKNVKYIDLSENKIRALKSRAFYGCSSLVTLNLYKNQISNIDSNAFRHLHKLEELSLGHNNLTTLPEDQFGWLDNLKRLDLSYNLINKIGLLGVDSLDALTNLDLSHNKITSLDWLWFPELTELRLDHNSITTLHIFHFSRDTFLNTPKLEYLDLGFNLMKELYLPDELNRLRRLNLKHNQLQSIKLPATTLMNIENLDLSDNNLTHLDESFQRFVYLQALSLNNNKLKSFPLCIPSRLTHLDLSQNELHDIALDQFCGSVTQGMLRLVDLSSNQFTSYNLTYTNKSLQETQPDLNDVDLSRNFLNADTVKQIQNSDLRHIEFLKIVPQIKVVVKVSRNENMNGEGNPIGNETITEKTWMSTSVENIESQRTPMVKNSQNKSTNEDWNLTGNRGNHENETTIQNTTALAPVDKSDQNEMYTTWIAATSAALAVGVFAVITAMLFVCKQRRRTNPNPNVNDAVMLNQLYDDVRPARADDNDRSSPDYDYPRFPPLYDDVGVQPTYLAVLPDIPGPQRVEQEDMEPEENHYEEIG